MLIVYRTCSLETNGNLRPFRPSWFSKDFCFKNSLDCFDKKGNEFIICYDGDDYSDCPWYEKLYNTNKEIVHLSKCGNNKDSLIALYKMVYLRINNHDSFYLIEDDFLHLKKSDEIIKEALLFTGMATLYHHPDRFFRSDDITSCDNILLGNYEYYRTMESTTGTFALTKERFSQLYSDLLLYNIDDRGFFRNCISKNIRLICPINSYATHVHLPFLSKFVNWEKLKRIN